ncbi:MAG: UDP-2,3-diacylglucosamine diphosphatase [Thalassobaculales bacterium]
MNAVHPINHYRSIWISDIHLGTRGCKAQFLLDFLKHNESEYLYLVGDILDVWRMQRSWYWAQAHNDVIQKVLRKARKGTKVIFVPGNHDEIFRQYIGENFGAIEIREEDVHIAADGKRYLVLHGDVFDGVVKYAKWLAFLGDSAYNFSMWVNHWFNAARLRFGYPYWSLSSYLKQRVKNAVEFVSRFEHAVAEEAARRGVDGVICGHIHKAEIRRIGRVLYCNDGDWVESCTALVEHADGRMEILDWAQVRQLSFATAA